MKSIFDRAAPWLIVASFTFAAVAMRDTAVLRATQDMSTRLMLAESQAMTYAIMFKIATTDQEPPKKMPETVEPPAAFQRPTR